nr:hypothetical protein [Streptomyces sp. SM10]
MPETISRHSAKVTCVRPSKTRSRLSPTASWISTSTKAADASRATGPSGPSLSDSTSNAVSIIASADRAADDGPKTCHAAARWRRTVSPSSTSS